MDSEEDIRLHRRRPKRSVALATRPGAVTPVASVADFEQVAVGTVLARFVCSHLVEVPERVMSALIVLIVR